MIGELTHRCQGAAAVHPVVNRAIADDDLGIAIHTTSSHAVLALVGKVGALAATVHIATEHIATCAINVFPRLGVFGIEGDRNTSILARSGRNGI